MYRSVISVVLIIIWDQALILHTVRPGNKALRSLLMMTCRDKSKGRNWLHTLYVASPGFLLSHSEEQALDFTEGSDMGKSLST